MKRRTVLYALLAVSAAAAAFGFLRARRADMSLTLSEKAPLSALAEITSFRPVRVSFRIEGMDGEDFGVDFGDYDRRHVLPLLGLYPDHDNKVRVTLTGRDGRVEERTLTLRTGPLPDMFPDIAFEAPLRGRMAPGMTFLHLGHYDEEGNFHPLPCAVDSFGRVRWFYDGHIGHVLERLANGNLLIHRGDTLVEMDMLGEETGRSWQVDTGIHHDALELPNGDLLALTSAPGSFEDGLVEIDRETGKHLRYHDFRTILDPHRPVQPRNLEEADWLHLNGIDHDPSGESVLLSGRDQSAVVLIDRESGALRWILGSHDHWPERLRSRLLEPEGGDFEWSWGQHAPMFHPGDPDRILVYDNGNKRSYNAPLEPGENYSRAVEYAIDEERMRVRQLWSYGGPGLTPYTPFIGDADYLPGGNRLVCFGGITRSLEGEPMELFDFEEGAVHRMKISAEILELTGDTPAQVVMRMRIGDPDAGSYRGYRSYRAVRMALYPERSEP